MTRQHLLERISHLPEDAIPITEPVLTEQPHGGIPGRVVAAVGVTPVAERAEPDPDRQTKAAGKVCHGRVGRDHQIELGQEGSRFGKVALRGPSRSMTGTCPRTSRSWPRPCSTCRLTSRTSGSAASDASCSSGNDRQLSFVRDGFPCQAIPIKKGLAGGRALFRSDESVPAASASSVRQCSTSKASHVR